MITAAHGFELVEGAYELRLEDVILPNGTAGTVVFRTCDECRNIGMRVGTHTRYLLRESDVPLADFLLVVEDIRASAGAEHTFVGVYYDLKTNVVTRIAVVPPDAIPGPVAVKPGDAPTTQSTEQSTDGNNSRMRIRR